MSKRDAVPVEHDDNPRWTKDDFARARPASEVLPAEVVAAFGKGKRGRPTGSTKPDAKQQVALRLDKEVIARFKAGGPGWQTRMNEALKSAVGL